MSNTVGAKGKKGALALVLDLIIMACLLGLDQLTKLLTIQKLKGAPALVLIQNVLEFQYLENRGSAFGMFENQKLFILSVSGLFMLVLLFMLFKMPSEKKYCALHIMISMVVAGGIGNMIDRLRFDYVVDFISFVLIHYPIFNVADIYVVIGTIGLAVCLIFVYKDEDLAFLSFRKAKNEEKE